MKKQLTLAALSLMTLAGGSWLAAQQREPLRTTRPPLPARASSGEVVSAASPDDEPAQTRRPSAAASAGTVRTRAAQDARQARAAVELYREDVPRYLAEVRAFDELSVAGQEVARQPIVFSAGIPQRMSPEDAARMRAFQDAIKELRNAKEPEEKTTAREQVTKLVSEQLEADLENREKELVAIEKRAKELRAQLEERKTAKPELLKMLVMLIDNPQVGLGIPPEWMQMLMRGQPERYRQGSLNFQNGISLFSPAAPPQRPMPPDATAPALDEDLEEEEVEEADADADELETEDIVPARATLNRY